MQQAVPQIKPMIPQPFSCPGSVGPITPYQQPDPQLHPQSNMPFLRVIKAPTSSAANHRRRHQASRPILIRHVRPSCSRWYPADHDALAVCGASTPQALGSTHHILYVDMRGVYGCPSAGAALLHCRSAVVRVSKSALSDEGKWA